MSRQLAGRYRHGQALLQIVRNLRKVRAVEELLKRIEIDPAKLGGKPVIRGTRIPVSLVVQLVAAGMKPDEIIREYPELTYEDIRAALLYAAKLVEKEVVIVIE